MMVFKDNFKTASPKLLEPIYNLEIKCPEEFVGDVMSDLPSRRGVILGIDVEGRYQKIKAKMPLAEVDKYRDVKTQNWLFLLCLIHKIHLSNSKIRLQNKWPPY